ncbi:MAG: Gfo/Idh/MocA family oxidoreductase [Erysipelothrix sp.]|nr:Gfo/Idh/MocA family oxidoreductase [Erysipelothrix sp.]
MKWGVYATGAIAQGFANDLKKVNGAVIVAAYARNEQKGRTFCEKYNIERYYNDEDAFFNDPEIEAVYVSTPHTLHAEVSIKALIAGKHVLCEKPFAMNANEAKRVIAVALEQKRFVMEALWTLFLPSIQKVFEWIQEDRIGEVKVIQANFGFSGNNDPQGRLLNPDLGGGALLDVGIYPVLMANVLAKSTPEYISAQASFTDTGVDGSTFIHFKYPNGIFALLAASIEVNLINDLVIYGEKGKIVVPLFWMADEATCYFEDKVEKFISDESSKSGYNYEAQALAVAVNAGLLQHDLVSHQFTIELMETLDRIRTEIGLVYKQDLQ